MNNEVDSFLMEEFVLSYRYLKVSEIWIIYKKAF